MSQAIDIDAAPLSAPVRDRAHIDLASAGSAVAPVLVASRAAPPLTAAPAAVQPASSQSISPTASSQIVAVLPDARVAYASGDGAVSRAVHDGGAKEAAEDHGGFGSDFIKSIVFGGLDGVITTFSTIASSVGGNLGIEAVITLAFANLVADAISMGAGDFLSSKAEFDRDTTERKREAWEFDNAPEGERDEMITALKKKGLDDEDAKGFIGIVSGEKHKNFFVDYMMIEELGLEIPDDPYGPAKGGAITFVSFCIFGALPLIVYVICWAAKWTSKWGIFGVAIAATVLTLFALGALQGKITRVSMLKSGLFMMMTGSLASAAAYLLAWGISKAVGVDC